MHVGTSALAAHVCMAHVASAPGSILYVAHAYCTEHQIMTIMHQYLGSDYQDDCRLLSGDQLTIERQIGSQRHRMDGDTVKERLGVLEPVTEDWHCMVCLLSVGSFMYTNNITQKQYMTITCMKLGCVHIARPCMNMLL